jgi:hypothetical protein
MSSYLTGALISTFQAFAFRHFRTSDRTFSHNLLTDHLVLLQVHGLNSADVCFACSIINHPLFKAAHHFFLSVNLRSCQDPDLQQWGAGDHTNITQQELDALFQACYITKEEAQQLLQHDTTVLCTHNAQVNHTAIPPSFAFLQHHCNCRSTSSQTSLLQVAEWNDFAVRKLHSAAPSVCTCQETCDCGYLHPVASILHPSLNLADFTNAHQRHAAEQFLAPNLHFDTLPAVATGCKVILQRNLSLQKRLVNGAIGTVQRIHLDRSRRPIKISVAFDGTSQPIDIIRCSTATALLGGEGGIYKKTTFPLALGHAMTGHKSQGATMPTPTILDIAAAFTRGLTYTMVTRVTSRVVLYIIGKLTPDMFTPTPFAHWLSPAGLAAYRSMPSPTL